MSARLAETLAIRELTSVVVYVPKRGRKAAADARSRLGRVHMTVFSPRGSRVAGVLVKRPDIAGMVKREDVFVALDSLAPCEGGLLVTRMEDGLDEAARARLGLDWDACVMWEGMDVETRDGKKLGRVADAVFDTTTGKVRHFCVSDGHTARSLVGDVELPPSLVLGYRGGRMVVKDDAASLELSGGLAARAGEEYAKAKERGRQAARVAKEQGAKASKAAGEAIDKGSRALGRQIGKTKGMFGSFVDEYKKASK